MPYLLNQEEAEEKLGLFHPQLPNALNHYPLETAELVYKTLYEHEQKGLNARELGWAVRGLMKFKAFAPRELPKTLNVMRETFEEHEKHGNHVDDLATQLHDSIEDGSFNENNLEQILHILVRHAREGGNAAELAWLVRRAVTDKVLTPKNSDELLPLLQKTMAEQEKHGNSPASLSGALVKEAIEGSAVTSKSIFPALEEGLEHARRGVNAGPVIAFIASGGQARTPPSTWTRLVRATPWSKRKAFEERLAAAKNSRPLLVRTAGLLRDIDWTYHKELSAPLFERALENPEIVGALEEYAREGKIPLAIGMLVSSEKPSDALVQKLRKARPYVLYALEQLHGIGNDKKQLKISLPLMKQVLSTCETKPGEWGEKKYLAWLKLSAKQKKALILQLK